MRLSVKVNRRGVLVGTAAAITFLRFGVSGPSEAFEATTAAVPPSVFSDTTGWKAEWAGLIPERGAVLCEFVAPAFGQMGPTEGLFNIRFAGGAPNDYQGVAAILKRETGSIDFGSRAVSGPVNIERGPSFHPGKRHCLFLSYDLNTGDVSMLLDAGSVFAIPTPRNWVNAPADRILLWEQKFIGSAAALSHGALTIHLFDARDLPG